MTMFLYILEERDWREREYLCSERLELELCRLADVVFEFSEGRFHVLKDRYGGGRA